MRKLLVFLMLFSAASYSYAQGLNLTERFIFRYVKIPLNEIQNNIQEGKLIDFNYKSRRNNKGQIELYAEHSSVSCGLYEVSETSISISIHTYHSPLEDLDVFGLDLMDDLADLSAESHNQSNKENIINLYNSLEKQGKAKNGEMVDIQTHILSFCDENKNVLDINRNAQLFVHKQKGYIMDKYTLAILIRINNEKDCSNFTQDMFRKYYIVPNGVRNISFMYEGKSCFIPLFEDKSEIYDVGYQLSKMKWVAALPEEYYKYIK